MEKWPEQFETTIRRNLLNTHRDVELTSTMSFARLGLDSLSIMALVTSLEQTFKKTLPPNALARGLDTTLGDLWTYCGGNSARSGTA